MTDTLESLQNELSSLHNKVRSRGSWLRGSQLMAFLSRTYLIGYLEGHLAGCKEGPQGGPDAPIDMILFCPSCGLQHIDEIETVLVWTGGGSAPEPSHEEVTWDNPPHRSHLCQGCSTIFRPADVATNGVRAITTKGKADRFVAAPARKLNSLHDALGDLVDDVENGYGDPHTLRHAKEALGHVF
jgi:hypothetical protein